MIYMISVRPRIFCYCGMVLRSRMRLFNRYVIIYTCCYLYKFHLTNKYPSSQRIHMSGFPKMLGFPNNRVVFPTKNDHFGVWNGVTTIWGNPHVYSFGITWDSGCMPPHAPASPRPLGSCHASACWTRPGNATTGQPPKWAHDGHSTYETGRFV